MSNIQPTPITLTVNGRKATVLATPRTQLAEVLRDQMNLTATHLACEQGVCGACTVRMNGRPVRSCLTFANSCDGAEIETLEGYDGDTLMDRLREAFNRNHALQCGFCTPGMLATSRDIVARLETPDEAVIRHELSGNLCRCTGYMGIVDSIRQVIEERNALGIAAEPAASFPEPDAAGFTPFEAEVTAAEKPEAGAAQGKTVIQDGWTVVSRRVTLDHAPDAVWDHFSDLNAVARCLPGAELTGHDAETFAGFVAVSFGPIKAKFEGEGHYTFDPATHTGRVEGRGKDRGGQSNVEGHMTYSVHPAESGDNSAVDVDFKFRIEGLLGQFNRPELVNGLVNHILAEFTANCDAVLSGGEVRESRGVSAWALLRSLIVSLFKK
ncbi:2Fe-2S iron-sulfur cluster binding domain-containing protein [Rhodospirillaceae bacterium KN72]|uniref:2Fe-2S iron-sulfur cluster binding domain-containing protein n=1 Tax=Pacificispira spongiicola TaxID=2729598 RepID=A0A7Y0DXH0_9PROT|nr:2Fe-2S iron-sulfur cluster-binding protein [Pacificispira spongiicola]NMM43408.1 2Fe-2S iron-sulfur cluster binding domain-containing protein [Pacificispira spongiicola]